MLAETAQMTRQTAEVENNSEYTAASFVEGTDQTVNAVERVMWYANTDTLPQERPHHTNLPESRSSWPAEGKIEFHNVEMSYRPGLPAALKHM